MKLVIIPEKLEDLELQKYDAYIVGLDKLSTNYCLELSSEEIKKLKDKYPDKECFVAINKNIFNDELEYLEKSLKSLDEIGVNGVLFYDLAVLYLKKKLHLKLDLVWNQTHLVTNYNTCNYYYQNGVKYAFLASEITLDEINEICSKAKTKTFALAFGYPIMSHTRRSLLTNYFKNEQIPFDGKMHTIKEKEEYLIKEDETGTSILYGKILNGVKLLTDSNIDYAVINLFNLEDKEKLISMVNDVMNGLDREEQLTSLIGDYTGFLFKKTIFKVKKDEK